MIRVGDKGISGKEGCVVAGLEEGGGTIGPKGIAWLVGGKVDASVGVGLVASNGT